MFGEVDERLPYTVLHVTQPVYLRNFRHATLAPGDYKVQGDARVYFRDIKARRLLGVKLTITYHDGDPDFISSRQKIVSARTLSDPGEVQNKIASDSALTDAVTKKPEPEAPAETEDPPAQAVDQEEARKLVLASWNKSAESHVPRRRTRSR